MGSEHDKPGKLFTVDEANAMLPLVRAIATDLAELSRDVIERRQRLSQLIAHGEQDHGEQDDERNSSDPYKSESVQIRDELENDARRLQDYVDELRQLGVEPKSAPEGLVDFPATMDDRRIYLCWKLGEPEVLYWHELDAGFPGRQPLAAGTAAQPTDETGGGESAGP